MSMLSTVAAWDNVADGYAAVTRNLFRTYSETALELLPLKADDLVADIACGPGTLTELALKQAAKVTAVDFSEKMIACLEASLAPADQTNVQTLVGDGQALALPEEQYNAAFSMFGLIFFPDRARGFSEMYRILKPGGAACVSSWAPIHLSPLLSTMFGVMKHLNPELEDPAYDVDSLENPELLKLEMQQAGFQDVCVHPVQGWSRFTSAQKLWQDMAA
ncbi:MAG: class I SAM-dependent methyltransferase [Pseudomonadota bacterium]